MNHDDGTATLAGHRHRLVMLGLCVPVLATCGVLVGTGVLSPETALVSLIAPVLMGIFVFVPDRTAHH